MSSKCAHALVEVIAASRSSSSHQLHRQSTPVVLSPRLVDAVGDQHAASGLVSTKCLPSKQTRGSDAGECRAAVAAYLQQHSSLACSWRSCPSRCPSGGTHPSLGGTATSAATMSQPEGVWTPEFQLNTRKSKGSSTMAVVSAGSCMRVVKVFPHLPHDFSEPPRIVAGGPFDATSGYGEELL